MALSVTQIQTIIDQLYDVASQKGGVLEVTFDGRKIKYDTINEVTKAIKFWESRLARVNGTRPRAMQHDLGNF